MGRKVVCLRYLLFSSFIILGISGVVVCGTGSYFLHQLRGSLTSTQWYGPPAILLTTGIINVILGPYFWHYFDAKHNQPQLLMFLIFVIFVAIIQAGAGIWSLVSHTAVDSSISEMLQEKLASVGTIDDRPVWNVTEIKVNCCGYDNSTASVNDESNKISWSCCNTRGYHVNLENLDTCVIFYMKECHQLALHRYRSILFHSFVLALCAVLLQIYTMVCMRSYSGAMKKWQKTRRAQSIVARGGGNEQLQNKCTAVDVGPQHVCEGCSSAQYQ